MGEINFFFRQMNIWESLVEWCVFCMLLFCARILEGMSKTNYGQAKVVTTPEKDCEREDLSLHLYENLKDIDVL